MSAAAAAAKSLQSCPTLCDPIDSSPQGSPVPGILQARTLEWLAIFFSNALKWKVKVKLLSHVRLLATPWTGAHLAPPSMGFFRQEYWNGVPLPSPTLMSRPTKKCIIYSNFKSYFLNDYSSQSIFFPNSHCFGFGLMPLFILRVFDMPTPSSYKPYSKNQEWPYVSVFSG